MVSCYTSIWFNHERLNMRKISLVKAGYTHKVSYEENVNGIGWVEKSFPTTSDAAKIHASSIMRKSEQYGMIRNIKISNI